MRYCIFILLLISLNTFSFSQRNDESNLFSDIVEKKIIEYKDKSIFVKASIFYLEGQWDSTLSITTKLQTHHDNQTIKNLTHIYRGVSFRQKNIFNEAKREFDKVSKDFEQYNLIQITKAGIAIELDLYDEALSYYEELLQIDDTLLLSNHKSKIIHNQGVCHFGLRNFVKSEKYFFESLVLQEKEKDTISLVGAYGDLANLYYEQYKDAKAIPYFQKAYQLAYKTNNIRLKQNVAINMSVVEENRKDYTKALSYRKEYEMWHDSLNDQNKIYEVAQLEKQFAVQQKQKEVSLLQVENKVKIAERNNLLYVAISLAILLAVGTYFYREKVKNNRTISAQKEVLNELNDTKDKLFSIVSHDLRTSVSTLKSNQNKLQSSYEQQDFQEVDTLLKNNGSLATSTYNLLDNLFYWALLQTKQNYFSIEPLKLYFIIEQVAYNFNALLQNKGITFANKVLKNTSILADQETLKIILRNLIDNAIKYTYKGGHINLYIQNDEETQCELVLEDTGIGISEDALTLLTEFKYSKSETKEHIKGTGLGLQLCKSMILENNGNLQIESKEGIGTKIIITLKKK